MGPVRQDIKASWIPYIFVAGKHRQPVAKGIEYPDGGHILSGVVEYGVDA